MDAPPEVKEVRVLRTGDDDAPWGMQVSGRIKGQTVKAWGEGKTPEAALATAYQQFNHEKEARALRDEQRATEPTTE